MNNNKTYFTESEVEKIQSVALEFMQSAAANSDMEPNSLANFLGWLRWRTEEKPKGGRTLRT